MKIKVIIINVSTLVSGLPTEFAEEMRVAFLSGRVISQKLAGLKECWPGSLLDAL
jgi:hypothetical protein